MTVAIDSSALTVLRRALGIAGTGSGQTDLDDGNLSQVIDVAAISRRSLAFGSGIWQFQMIFVHSNTTGRNIIFDPYEPRTTAGGTSSNKNGYPTIVPHGFDVWLIAMSLTTNDATDFSSVTAGIVTAATASGMNITNTNGVSTSPGGAALEFPLAHWDTTDVMTNGTIAGLTIQGDLIARLGYRLRRGERISVDSVSDTGGTVTNSVTLTLGLFPVALGQDVAY